MEDTNPAAYVDCIYRVAGKDADTGASIQVATGIDGYGVHVTILGDYYGKADFSMSKEEAKVLGETLIKISNEVL